MSGKRRAQSRTVQGPFALIPDSVLRSPGYASLSGSGYRLLGALAAQFRRGRNGALGTALKRLRPYGFTNDASLVRARRELVERGLIFETRKGRVPNVETWYALTWQDLDENDQHDEGVSAAFRAARNGFTRYVPEKSKRVAPSKQS